MGNGSSNSHIRNDCNFCVNRSEKVVGTGIKSNDRCSDASDECVGSYDASILTRFRPANSKFSDAHRELHALLHSPRPASSASISAPVG